MKPDIELRFAHEAEDDIDDILQYTFEAWGSVQEQSYRETLRQAFLSIRDNPGISWRRADGHDREFRLRHHAIVYHHDEAANTVTILRIVNTRRRSR